MSVATANTTNIAETHVWPEEGSTRIPDWVYTSQEIYELEVERIFRGKTWNYVALEVEFPIRATSSGAMSAQFRCWSRVARTARSRWLRTVALIAVPNFAASIAATRRIWSAPIINGPTI